MKRGRHFWSITEEKQTFLGNSIGVDSAHMMRLIFWKYKSVLTQERVQEKPGVVVMGTESWSSTERKEFREDQSRDRYLTGVFFLKTIPYRGWN